MTKKTMTKSTLREPNDAGLVGLVAVPGYVAIGTFSGYVSTVSLIIMFTALTTFLIWFSISLYKDYKKN